VKKGVPMLYEYWKKSTVTEADRNAYHAAGWLAGWAISDLEFPTVEQTTIICFESHLLAGLGLPPCKFHVSILNFFRCELVHLNPSAIVVLSCFTIVDVVSSDT
jgi:hypothetical protein